MSNLQNLADPSVSLPEISQGISSGGPFSTEISTIAIESQSSIRSQFPSRKLSFFEYRRVADVVRGSCRCVMV